MSKLIRNKKVNSQGYVIYKEDNYKKQLRNERNKNTHIYKNYNSSFPKKIGYLNF